MSASAVTTSNAPDGDQNNDSHTGTLNFVLFLLIDHFFSKKPAVVMATKPARATSHTVPEARLQPQLVNGFRVPENLRYHPGHTWALNESPSLVRIGIDDFASKMIGKISLSRSRCPSADSGYARDRRSGA